MGRSIMTTLALVAALAACGGSRDRPPGTREGSGAPTGETRDSGVAQGVDGGEPARDGGIPGIDGGLPDSGAPAELDPSEDVSNLEPDELATLCQIVIAATGTEEVICPGEIAVTPATYEQCVSGAYGAGCTVGAVLTCMSSLEGDLCNLFATEGCAEFLECGSGGG